MKYINQINIILMAAAVAFCLWVATETFLSQPQRLQVPAASARVGQGDPGQALPGGSRGLTPASGQGAATPRRAVPAAREESGADLAPAGVAPGGVVPGGSDAASPYRPSGGAQGGQPGPGSVAPSGRNPTSATGRSNPLATPDSRPGIGTPASRGRGVTRTPPPPMGARGSAKRDPSRSPNPPPPRGSTRRNH
ncbi:MAG TPA: hypothetical protein VLU25_13785 [Acidobacteriota bacterium]|nr:hypothetical protein [Acidobacteriota bacterium]